MRPWRISFLLDSVRYHDDVKTTTTSKVWLVQSQDPDVRLILQIDIVMCLIYNISAMPWRYRRWCHSNFVKISECPLGGCLKSASFISTNADIYTKPLTSSESVVKVKSRHFCVIFLTSAVISKQLLFHENKIL